MDPGLQEEVALNLRRCLKTGKEHFFYFLPKAEDGEPVLFVERKEAPVKKLGKEARKKAQVKMPALGRVLAAKDRDGLVFVNEGKLPCERMVKLFRTELAKMDGLKKVAMLLRNAQIYTVPEFEAAGDELVAAPVPSRGDGSDEIEALFEKAQAQVELVHSALEGHPQHGAAGALVKQLHDAYQTYQEGGDAPAARAALTEVGQGAKALAEAAHAHELARVRAEYDQLKARFADDPRWEEAIAPVDAKLRAEGAEQKLARKLELLLQADALLDDVADVFGPHRAAQQDGVADWADLLPELGESIETLNRAIRELTGKIVAQLDPAERDEDGRARAYRTAGEQACVPDAVLRTLSTAETPEGRGAALGKLDQAIEALQVNGFLAALCEHPTERAFSAIFDRALETFDRIREQLESSKVAPAPV